jgi:hypothetical protein
MVPCIRGTPLLESVVAMLGPRASSRRRWQHGIQWIYVVGLLGVYGWLGWLLPWWRGLGLWPTGMDLRPEAPLRVSSWVVFHGCFVELVSMMGGNVGIC